MSYRNKYESSLQYIEFFCQQYFFLYQLCRMFLEFTLCSSILVAETIVQTFTQLNTLDDGKNPFEMQVHTSESKTHINTQKYCSQNMTLFYSTLKHNFYHITRNNFVCEKVGQTLEFLKQYNDFLLQIVELIAPEFFIHLFKYSGYTEIYLFYTVC